MRVETSAWSHCIYEGISTQHLQIKVYFCICLDTETEVLTTSKLLKFVFVKESSKTKHYYVFALAAIETWNIYEWMTWFEKVKWSWNSENSHICCRLVKNWWHCKQMWSEFQWKLSNSSGDMVLHTNKHLLKVFFWYIKWNFVGKTFAFFAFSIVLHIIEFLASFHKIILGINLTFWTQFD